MRITILSLVTLLLVSCSTIRQNADKHPLGLSEYNPVRVNGPRGQREYLSRLICPNGQAVTAFSRVGSVGSGPYGSILDLYEIDCGNKTYSVYMDMYHPNYKEDRPIDGFTIQLKM